MFAIAFDLSNAETQALHPKASGRLIAM